MRLKGKDRNERFSMTPLEAAICGMVDKIEMFMMSFYIEMFRDKPLLFHHQFSAAQQSLKKPLEVIFTTTKNEMTCLPD
jgi:hypothetical protein